VTDEQDPEALADLRLRAASMHDHTRTRPTKHAWTPPAIVDRWPCKTGCGLMVDVPIDAVQALEVFNAQLKRQRERPIAQNQIMLCDKCKAKILEQEAEEKRTAAERVAFHVAALNATKGIPTEERGILEQLKRWGHPDPEGLAKAIAERRAAERGSNKPKRGL
jgi:hypothetical protein